MPTGGFGSHLDKDAPYHPCPQPLEVGRLVFPSLLETMFAGVDKTPDLLHASKTHMQWMKPPDGEVGWGFYV